MAQKIPVYRFVVKECPSEKKQYFNQIIYRMIEHAR